MRCRDVRETGVGRPGRGRPRAQADFFKRLRKRGDGVAARGEEVEGELDERRPLRIDGDRGDLALGHVLARVEVAEPGGPVAAARGVLALEPQLPARRIYTTAQASDEPLKVCSERIRLA